MTYIADLCQLILGGRSEREDGAATPSSGTRDEDSPVMMVMPYDDEQLLLVWLAVVYWFAIKSVALNQWARSTIHE